MEAERKFSVNYELFSLRKILSVQTGRYEKKSDTLNPLTSSFTTESGKNFSFTSMTVNSMANSQSTLSERSGSVTTNDKVSGGDSMFISSGIDSEQSNGGVNGKRDLSVFQTKNRVYFKQVVACSKKRFHLLLCLCSNNVLLFRFEKLFQENGRRRSMDGQSSSAYSRLNLANPIIKEFDFFQRNKLKIINVAISQSSGRLVSVILKTGEIYILSVNKIMFPILCKNLDTWPFDNMKAMAFGHSSFKENEEIENNKFPLLSSMLRGTSKYRTKMNYLRDHIKSQRVKIEKQVSLYDKSHGIVTSSLWWKTFEDTRFLIYGTSKGKLIILNLQNLIEECLIDTGVGVGIKELTLLRDKENNCTSLLLQSSNCQFHTIVLEFEDEKDHCYKTLVSFYKRGNDLEETKKEREEDQRVFQLKSFVALNKEFPDKVGRYKKRKGGGKRGKEFLVSFSKMKKKKLNRSMGELSINEENFDQNSGSEVSVWDIAVESCRFPLFTYKLHKDSSVVKMNDKLIFTVIKQKGEMGMDDEVKPMERLWVVSKFLAGDLFFAGKKSKGKSTNESVAEMKSKKGSEVFQEFIFDRNERILGFLEGKKRFGNNSSNLIEGCFLYSQSSLYELKQKNDPEIIFNSLLGKFQKHQKIDRALTDQFGKTFELDLFKYYEDAADKNFDLGNLDLAFQLYSLSNNVNELKLIGKMKEVEWYDERIDYLSKKLENEKSITVSKLSVLSDLLFDCFMDKIKTVSFGDVKKEINESIIDYSKFGIKKRIEMEEDNDKSLDLDDDNEIEGDNSESEREFNNEKNELDSIEEEENNEIIENIFGVFKFKDGCLLDRFQKFLLGKSYYDLERIIRVLLDTSTFFIGFCLEMCIAYYRGKTEEELENSKNTFDFLFMEMKKRGMGFIDSRFYWWIVNVVKNNEKIFELICIGVKDLMEVKKGYLGIKQNSSFPDIQNWMKVEIFLGYFKGKRKRKISFLEKEVSSHLSPVKNKNKLDNLENINIIRKSMSVENIDQEKKANSIKASNSFSNINEESRLTPGGGENNNNVQSGISEPFGNYYESDKKIRGKKNFESFIKLILKLKPNQRQMERDDEMDNFEILFNIQSLIDTLKLLDVEKTIFRYKNYSLNNNNLQTSSKKYNNQKGSTASLGVGVIHHSNSLTNLFDNCLKNLNSYDLISLNNKERRNKGNSLLRNLNLNFYSLKNKLPGNKIRDLFKFEYFEGMNIREHFEVVLVTLLCLIKNIDCYYNREVNFELFEKKKENNNKKSDDDLEKNGEENEVEELGKKKKIFDIFEEELEVYNGKFLKNLIREYQNCYRRKYILQKCMVFENLKIMEVLYKLNSCWINALDCRLDRIALLEEEKKLEKIEKTFEEFLLQNNFGNLEIKVIIMKKILRFCKENQSDDLKVEEIEKFLMNHLEQIDEVLSTILLEESDENEFFLNFFSKFYYVITQMYILSQRKFDQSEKKIRRNLQEQILKNLEQELLPQHECIPVSHSELKKIDADSSEYYIFTCGHTFEKEDFEDNIITFFVKKMRSIGMNNEVARTKNNITCLLIQKMFKEKRFQIGCPKCTFNYFK